MSVMNMHAPIVPEQAPEPGLDLDRHDPPSAFPDPPTLAERLGETVPLLSAPAFFGPPVIFLFGPWLLLALLLIPPAAFLIMLVVIVAVVAGLLVALGALIASPYLLVRRRHARHSVAHAAPTASEVTGARGEPAVTRSVRPRLVHLTSR